MNVTVYGPNLPNELSRKGTLHVHKTGCADTKRGAYTRLRMNADQGGWTLDVEDIAAIIEDCYPSGDFDYDPTDPDEYDPYRSDVYVAPCVTLPENAPTYDPPRFTA